MDTLAVDNLELLVYKHSIALDAVQRLPDYVRFVEEAKVRNEKVEAVALLDHRGEVIVAEEDS